MAAIDADDLGAGGGQRLSALANHDAMLVTVALIARLGSVQRRKLGGVGIGGAERGALGVDQLTVFRAEDVARQRKVGDDRALSCDQCDRQRGRQPPAVKVQSTLARRTHGEVR